MSTQPQNEPDLPSDSKKRKDLLDNLSQEDVRKLERAGFVDMVQRLLQCVSTAHASDPTMQQTVRQLTDRIITTSGLSDMMNLKTEIFEFGEKTVDRIQALLKENHALHERYHSLEARFFDFRSKVVVDEVTETFSRDAFDGKLEQMIQKFKEEPYPLFLALIEVDDFPAFKKKLSARETSGFLHSFASRVKGGVRDSDPIYRYNEHQFTALFQHIVYKTTPIIGDRICIKVNMAPVSLTGEATTDPAAQVKATASIGFAQFREGDDAETFFKRAHAAVERVRANGGNQVALS